MARCYTPGKSESMLLRNDLILALSGDMQSECGGGEGEVFMAIMRRTELLRTYLADPSEVDAADSGYPFVTISREPGAGGHTLGREIIRQLDASADEHWNHGWDLFDQNMCAYLAQDPTMQATFDELLKEEYKTGVHQAVQEMLTGNAESYNLQKKIFRVVKFLTRMGKVVVIGRAGMCISRMFRAGVHVRLVAPLDVRIRRMADSLEVDAAAAKKEIHRQENDRVRLIHDFFNSDIRNPLLYDVVFNTATTDNVAIARAAVELIRARRAVTSDDRHALWGE